MKAQLCNTCNTKKKKEKQKKKNKKCTYKQLYTYIVLVQWKRFIYPKVTKEV